MRIWVGLSWAAPLSLNPRKDGVCCRCAGGKFSPSQRGRGRTLVLSSRRQLFVFIRFYWVPLQSVGKAVDRICAGSSQIAFNKASVLKKFKGCRGSRRPFKELCNLGWA